MLEVPLGLEWIGDNGKTRNIIGLSILILMDNICDEADVDVEASGGVH